MGTYVEIDGKLYVTKEDYLNIVKYYENSLLAERNGAEEEIAELEEENKKLKAEKNKLYIDYENLSNYNVDLIQENERLKEELRIVKELYKVNVD